MKRLNDPRIAAAGLTAIELDTLSRIYFDGKTQQMVADEDRVTRSAVQIRVQSGLRKLHAAGLPAPKAPAPRHRRRDGRPTFEPVDPELLKRLRRAPSGRYILGNPRIVDRRR